MPCFIHQFWLDQNPRHEIIRHQRAQLMTGIRAVTDLCQDSSYSYFADGMALRNNVRALWVIRWAIDIELNV